MWTSIHVRVIWPPYGMCWLMVVTARTLWHTVSVTLCERSVSSVFLRHTVFFSVSSFRLRFQTINLVLAAGVRCSNVSWPDQAAGQTQAEYVASHEQLPGKTHQVPSASSCPCDAGQAMHAQAPAAHWPRLLVGLCYSRSLLLCLWGR